MHLHEALLIHRISHSATAASRIQPEDMACANAGNGEAVDGCVQLVRQALRRSSPAVPVVLHLPRVETWAVHSVCAPAATDDSQADATSPAAAFDAAEQGVGRASRSPYGCVLLHVPVHCPTWGAVMHCAVPPSAWSCASSYA